MEPTPAFEAPDGYAVTAPVDEPFRSDPAFWSSMATCVDALLAVVFAAVVAVVISIFGGGTWALLPFAVAAAAVIRAGRASTRSSRDNRTRFPDHATWREAERRAVAAAFLPALRRRFGRS